MLGRLAGGSGADSAGITGFADTTKDYTLLDDIRIEHPFLFKIVRNGVLCQQGRR